MAMRWGAICLAAILPFSCRGALCDISDDECEPVCMWLPGDCNGPLQPSLLPVLLYSGLTVTVTYRNEAISGVAHALIDAATDNKEGLAAIITAKYGLTCSQLAEILPQLPKAMNHAIARISQAIGRASDCVEMQDILMDNRRLDMVILAISECAGNIAIDRYAAIVERSMDECDKAIEQFSPNLAAALYDAGKAVFKLSESVGLWLLHRALVMRPNGGRGRMLARAVVDYGHSVANCTKLISAATPYGAISALMNVWIDRAEDVQLQAIYGAVADVAVLEACLDEMVEKTEFSSLAVLGALSGYCVGNLLADCAVQRHDVLMAMEVVLKRECRLAMRYDPAAVLLTHCERTQKRSATDIELRYARVAAKWRFMEK